jgi:serine/threonine protein kinase
MGEVYKARDVRLDRTVAVKVLHASLASDPQFRERFDREARAVAALNHPNICALHDVGHQDGFDYLVMEYVTGVTLAQRIRQGRIEFNVGIRILIEIAHALDAAHRAGIVHRDLKPANVMLTKVGVKLLDFGIAKLRWTEAPTDASTDLAPLPLTVEGAILGTLHYMSPEQLEGLEADHRSDIWAFGCVCYEVMTGQRAFDGSSRASIVAAIMSARPPLLSEGTLTNRPIFNRAVQKCLAKDREDRWQTMHDLAGELQWIVESPRLEPTASGTQLQRWRTVAVAAAILAIGALIVVWMFSGTSDVSNQLGQFLITAPTGVTLRELAVSPDSQRIALVGFTQDGATHLWFRDIDDPHLVPVTGVGNPSSPFWSPDSAHIAFFSDGTLQKLAIGQHSPAIVTHVNTKSVYPRPGGTWNRDNTILYTDDDGSLRRVSASGGESTSIYPAGTGQLWPAFLSDGRHFLFTDERYRRWSGARPNVTYPPNPGIFLGSLDSPNVELVLGVDSRVAVLQSDEMLFVEGSTLNSQRVDARTWRVMGTPRRLAEGFRANPGYPQFSGTSKVLAYLAQPQSQLIWVDRHRNPVGPIAPPGDDSTPTLSPDGRRLAVTRRDPITKVSNIWVINLATGSPTQLTYSASSVSTPLWSGDGSRVAFGRRHDAETTVVEVRADGIGGERELFKVPNMGLGPPCDWSVDGRLMVFATRSQLMVVPLRQGESPFATEASSLSSGCDAQFSPDGRWLIYAGLRVAGTLDVTPGYIGGYGTRGLFLRRLSDGKETMLMPDGSAPRWRSDGKEIFYVSDRNLRSVSFDGAAMRAGAPQDVFDLGNALAIPFSSPYAVTADGQRFIIKVSREGYDANTATVVLNRETARTSEGLFRQMMRIFPQRQK